MAREGWGFRTYEANKTHTGTLRGPVKQAEMWPETLRDTAKGEQGRSKRKSVGNSCLVTEVTLSCFCDVPRRVLIGSRSVKREG